jgi:hypothetical protein
VRRDCFHRFGTFNLDYRVLADAELLVRLLVRNRCRSVLCPLIGTEYADGGFSSTPENVRLSWQERLQIGHRHFSSYERFVYRLILGVSLRGAREYWLHRHPLGTFARNYTFLSNFIHRRVL